VLAAVIEDAGDGVAGVGRGRLENEGDRSAGVNSEPAEFEGIG